MHIDDIFTVARPPIYGLLDNIRSLYNVGSIFRTSDGALVRKLCLCGYTPHPPRKEIDKTALGATRSVPWEYYQNPLLAIDELRAQGAKICVLEQTTHSKPYFDICKGDFPLARRPAACSPTAPFLACSKMTGRAHSKSWSS